MLEELFRALEVAQNDANTAAIVIAGANGKFSAGFDITYLAKQQAETSGGNFGTDVNMALIKVVESGNKPTVAGACERSCLEWFSWWFVTPRVIRALRRAQLYRAWRSAAVSRWRWPAMPACPTRAHSLACQSCS